MTEKLFALLSLLRSRPKLIVRINADNIEEEIGGLKFEVENVSDKSTSLAPVVVARFLTTGRKKCSIIFDVREMDRSLPPFISKQFTASAREHQPARSNAWFRTYTLSLIHI